MTMLSNGNKLSCIYLVYCKIKAVINAVTFSPSSTTSSPFPLFRQECTIQEKDRDGCPKIVNLGSAKTDLFYERKKYGFKKRWPLLKYTYPAWTSLIHSFHSYSIEFWIPVGQWTHSLIAACCLVKDGEVDPVCPFLSMKSFAPQLLSPPFIVSPFQDLWILMRLLSRFLSLDYPIFERKPTFIALDLVSNRFHLPIRFQRNLVKDCRYFIDCVHHRLFPSPLSCVASFSRLHFRLWKWSKLIIELGARFSSPQWSRAKKRNLWQWVKWQRRMGKRWTLR